MRTLNWVRNFVPIPSPRGLFAVLALGIAAGTGTASAFFLWALDVVTGWRQGNPWLLGLLPFLGVVLVWGYQRWGRGSERGNLLVLEELRTGHPTTPPRLAPHVLLATLLTHLGGGSAGREGTAVQMGAGIAAALAGSTPRPDPAFRRGLLLAGIAAGFGSVFGTPWAGAFFALEFQLADSFLDFRRPAEPSMRPDGRCGWRGFPLVLAAGWLGHRVCLAWGAQHLAYPHPTWPGPGLGLRTVVAVGLAAGLTARFYLLLGRAIERGWYRWVPQVWIRPILGAVAILGASLLLQTDAYLGLGVRHPLASEPSLWRAFEPGGVTSWSWLWKLCFTAVTLGSGFKGGEVTPLLFVGATLGQAVALAFGLPVSLSAALGMVAVFGAAARTPVACAVMGMELFGLDSGPGLLVAGWLAFSVAGRVGIYSAKA